MTEIFPLLNDFDSIVQNSFDNFISTNNVTYPNLRSEDVSKWKFEEEIISKYNFTSSEILDKIPNLSQGSPKVSFVKMFVQTTNVIENQLYMCTNYNKDKQKYEVNKYHELPSLDLSEDDLGGDAIGDSLLSDRLVLEGKLIKGLNKYYTNYFEYQNQLNFNKIIIYDYTNSFSKINQNLLVIGVAYLKEDAVILHAWKIIDKYIPLRAREMASTMQFDSNVQINLLKAIFNKIFFNDELTSDYAILFIFSQVLARVGEKNIGVFPLNVIFPNDPEGSLAACNNFYNFMQTVNLYTVKLDLTTDNLNNLRLYPIFDENKEELLNGDLQLCDKTFIILNELSMNAGEIKKNGIQNVATIRNLIDFQMMTYQYPYNHFEIPQDNNIISFTKDSRTLFNSVFIYGVPLVKNGNESSYNEVKETLLSLFYYINSIKFNEDFSNKFTIKDEVSSRIQEAYSTAVKPFNADEFDLLLRLARIHAISLNRKEMLFEDYEYVWKMESERKKRLEIYLKDKKKQ